MLAEVVALPNVALRTLGVFAVHVIVGDEMGAHLPAGVTVILVERTETVVLIDHVVHLQLRRPSFPY